MSYEFKDNTREVLSALQKAKRRGLEAIGMTAERYAKQVITEAGAIDTGRLRNSLTYAISGESAHISSYSGDHGEEGGTYSGTAPYDIGGAVFLGTNVSYAEGIELGTHRKKGAVHMLKRAATEHNEEYQKLMRESLENA